MKRGRTRRARQSIRDFKEQAALMGGGTITLPTCSQCHRAVFPTSIDSSGRCFDCIDGKTEPTLFQESA